MKSAILSSAILLTGLVSNASACSLDPQTFRSQELANVMNDPLIQEIIQVMGGSSKLQSIRVAGHQYLLNIDGVGYRVEPQYQPAKNVPGRVAACPRFSGVRVVETVSPAPN